MDARIAARRRFRDGSNPRKRLDSHSERMPPFVTGCSYGVACRLRGLVPHEVYSSELDDAVEGYNTALHATAVVASLERLKRVLNVDALIPHIYTNRL